MIEDPLKFFIFARRQFFPRLYKTDKEAKAKVVGRQTSARSHTFTLDD